jgi:dolichyl-phosphate beta-glucosyltransferase
MRAARLQRCAKESVMSTLVPLPAPAYVDLSIVIPAYNEAKRIVPTLQALARFVASQPLRTEILVIDDGSSDDTVAVVEAQRAVIAGLRVVRQLPNRGKGAAVRLGMLTARAPIRMMCDADGSMPPEEMRKLLSALIDHRADIAIGSRYIDGKAAASQPLYRRLWSRLCNQVIQRTLVPGIVDTQCGFKAFTAEAARELFGRSRIDGWAFDLEILALALRRGYHVEEIGVTWVDDPRSRVNPLADMWKVMGEAWTIRRNLRHGVYRRPARVLAVSDAGR